MIRRAEKRWQQRWEPLRVQGQASRIIKGRTRTDVWAFVESASSSVLISEDVVRAFTVPGTGPGVGEQQCTIMRENGRKVPSVVTVTAYEEGVCAETVSHSADVAIYTRTEVAEEDGGTRLVLTSWLDAHPGAHTKDLETTRQMLASHADTYVARVKVLLESGHG